VGGNVWTFAGIDYRLAALQVGMHAVVHSQESAAVWLPEKLHNIV